MTKDEIERKNKELSNMAGMIQNSHPAQQAQLLPYRGLIGAIGAIGQFPF
jgi:hypothetical protein